MINEMNDLIKYFSNDSIQFTDLLVTSLNPHMQDNNRYTASHYSGLVITISGSANFSLNGMCYEVNKKVVLHAGPMMEIAIKVTSDEPWHYVVLHYKSTENIGSYKHTHFSMEIGEQPKMEDFVQQIIQADKIPGDLHKLKCKSLFLHIVETMLSCAKLKTSCNVVDQAINYMTQNYAQPIAIAQIAEEVGCDRRRLAYLFDKQVGLSPIQFLTEIRLKHSRDLLCTTKMPIKEIAERVGYQDAFYFCRVFKKQYEMTPSEYRKQC